MRLQLLDGSRVFIDLRATGMLRALAHSPTLTCVPERVTVDFEGREGEASVEASFRAAAIEAPVGIPPADRAKMLDNLRGREVLDAARFPTLDFRGQYAGSLSAGTLAGDLRVRSVSRRLSIPVRVSEQASALVATGAWEGALADLGIKPFKALLGAIKLEDWIALRLDVRFARPPHDT
jgi:polyisoprenoid-binding protein YceI